MANEEESGDSIIKEKETEDASSKNVGSNAPISTKKAYLDDKWVNSIKERLPEELSPSLSCSIYRVPHNLRRLNEHAYIPQVVSVGPLHHGEERLQAMEEHKWRYLNSILSRKQIKEGNLLEQLLLTVKLLEERARSYYSEKINLDSNSFVEMMVLDGCFIIELFASAYGCVWSEGIEDPILKLEIHRGIVFDFLKLENQIPFIILRHLYDVLNFPGPSLEEIAFAFFNFFQPKYKKANRPNHHVWHLLHLLHLGLLPHEVETLERGNANMIQPISELQNRGMKLETRNTDSFFDIKFQKDKGVIQIPLLTIEENTKLIFLNLVALEQCYVYSYFYLTAYITFMNCLIKSVEDVRFLCENGIIDNNLGSNEEVADFFNAIKSDIAVSREDFYLVNVFNDINRYPETAGQVQRTKLKRNFLLRVFSSISNSHMTH